jgi:L-2-hydroxyglutarate oxidase LhgO
MHLTMPDSNTHYDVAIVGGGIVGLATALSLTKKRPGLRLLLLEKEKELAFHQTGHNSGTIHSGIYYRPGTLKAKLCVQGAQSLIAFCKEHGIPFELCGKVAAATSQEELPRLAERHRRGTANGVPGVRLIGPAELKELEPEARGLQALHVPSAGIVDFKRVAAFFAKQLQESAAEITTDTALLKINAGRDSGRLLLETTRGEIRARYLINCGGLFSDRIAKRSGEDLAAQIIPFRGDYYELTPSRRNLVRGLIYPAPDPSLPFLGVHLSRTIQGTIEIGPNAVLALKREGYRKTDWSLRDLTEMISFPGFWKMSAKFWKIGCEEFARSLNKKLFVRSVQRLVPAVQEEDLVPSKSGVRAQAVDRSGALLDDFHLIEGARTLHVINAPSPAATASLAIGDYVAEAALRHL